MATRALTYPTSHREEYNGVKIRMVEIEMEDDYPNPGGWHFNPGDFGFKTRVGAMVLNNPPGFIVMTQLVPTGVNVRVDKVANTGGPGVDTQTECADNEAGLDGITIAGFVLGY